MEITTQSLLIIVLGVAGLLVAFKILKNIIAIGILAVLAILAAKYFGVF